VGSYDLQEFNLYYITRYGLRPSKMAFLCQHRLVRKIERHLGGSLGSRQTLRIKKWLEIFVHRFFQLSQFKRSQVGR
jgi:NAD+ synthase (glutamine-hydrolysing)